MSPRTPTPAPRTTRPQWTQPPVTDNPPPQSEVIVQPPPPASRQRTPTPPRPSPPPSPWRRPLSTSPALLEVPLPPTNYQPSEFTHTAPMLTEGLGLFHHLSLSKAPTAREHPSSTAADYEDRLRSNSAPPATNQSATSAEPPVDSQGLSDAELDLKVTHKLMPVKANYVDDVRHWKAVGKEASIKSPPALADFLKTPPAIGDVFTYESTGQKKAPQAWIFRASAGNSTACWQDISKVLTEHMPLIPHPNAKGFCLWLRDDYTPNYIKHDTYKTYVAKFKSSSSSWWFPYRTNHKFKICTYIICKFTIDTT